MGQEKAADWAAPDLTSEKIRNRFPIKKNPEKKWRAVENVHLCLRRGLYCSASCNAYLMLNRSWQWVKEFDTVLQVDILPSNEMSHLMRLWHFSSSLNSFFIRACAAIQWGLDVCFFGRTFHEGLDGVYWLLINGLIFCWLLIFGQKFYWLLIFLP